MDLVTEIARAGLPVPHPREVSAQTCPSAGCTGAVDTDTLSVLKFPTTGSAELFAGGVRGVYQVEDFVLTFTSDVDPGRRADYEAVVRRAVG